MKKPLLKLAKLNGRAEIFHSIQGEGKSLGVPSVFVRTSLCNLHCIWCDTDYTWNWTDTPFPHIKDDQPGYRKFVKKDWLTECAAEDVAEQVAAYQCPNVILTGGEPMLQQPELLRLMQVLRKRSVDFRFEVETNGTILPEAGFDAAIDQYNVSPKLENSNNPVKLREKPATLRFFAASPKAHFKFVIAGQSDLDEVLKLTGKYHIPTDRVWLMPEGSSRSALARRRKWLVEIVKQHGFRYTDRLHIQIWGSKKGV